jgi:hypothetical protein
MISDIFSQYPDTYIICCVCHPPSSGCRHDSVAYFSQKSGWTTIVNGIVMLGGNCGLFAIGYHTLGGFVRDRETGVIVIALYLLVGLVFTKQVNSRNVTLLPLLFMLSTTGFLMLYRLSLSLSRIVTTEFIKQLIFIALGLILMLGLIEVLKLIFLLNVHGDRLELLGISRSKVLLGRIINRLVVQPRFSYHIWLILTMVLLAIPLFSEPACASARSCSGTAE